MTTEEREEAQDRFNAQITLYLNGPEKSSTDITFQLLAVNIISEEDRETGIISRPVTISSDAVEGRQVLLGEKSLPEGKYHGLKMVIKEASITKEGRTASLALPEGAIETNIDVTLGRNQSTTLFLNWNPDASVQDGYLFRPAFAVKGQVPELSSLLIYVTNEDSNSVSVINRQSGDVAATVMVGKKPRGIVTSKSGERLRVYVANSGSNSISVIDPTTHTIYNEVPVRFGRQPEAIALAIPSADSELLFTANYGSDNVSVIDATTYQETEKIEVGRGPIAIAADPPVRELVGASSLSFGDQNVLRNYRERFFNVYVVNNDSNDVSIIRMDKTTKKSTEVITISVEWRPVALYVDYPRGKVYVANYDSDKLSVIDIVRVVKGDTGNAVSIINNVGSSTIGVISDPAINRLYLLKESPGEIMIIRPITEGDESFRSALPPVVGTIPVGISPRSFIIDPEIRKLYVVNRGSDTVSVIDRTTKREEEVVSVGRNPYGIAVFPR